MKEFGDAEAERLAAALKSNTNLKHISASGHRLSNNALQTLGQAIAVQGRIQSVAIGDSSMGDEGVKSFCSSFEHCDNQLGIIEFGRLVELDFSKKGLHDGSGFGIMGRSFAFSKTLQKVNISQNSSSLDVNVAEFSKHALAVARSQPNSVLFPNLKQLDLSDTSTGPTGLHSLVELLMSPMHCKYENILILNLANNPLIGSNPYCLDRIAYLICCSQRIRSLNLSKCQINDEGMMALLAVPEMDYSNVESLELLDLSDNIFGVLGANRLAKALKSSSSDDELHTSCNLSALKKINLAGNPLTDIGVLSIASALYSAENIGGNDTLKIIDLSRTGCALNGAINILLCSKIKSLRLFDNKLGDEGFIGLAPLLKSGNACLEHIDLGGNSAKASAVNILLRSLLGSKEGVNSRSSLLNTLELGGNEIDAEGEDLIQMLLLENSSLDIARDRPLSH